MHGNPPWRSNPSIPYTSQKNTHPSKRGTQLVNFCPQKAPPQPGCHRAMLLQSHQRSSHRHRWRVSADRLMFSDSSGDPWEKKTTALKIPESYGIVKLLIETIDVLLLCNFWVGKVQKETTSFVTCHFYYWYWLSDEEQPFFFQGNHIFVFLTAHLSLWLLQ